MNWRDRHNQIELDERGEPMFRGLMRLDNDRGERLASICWFSDDGPFYAHAVDLREPDVMRRIGPCSTLDGAKDACSRVIEGSKDVSGRAGYQR